MPKLLNITLSCLLLAMPFAAAAQNQGSNETYVQKMQQAINQANANASVQFQKNYPKPVAPSLQNAQGASGALTPGNNAPAAAADKIPAMPGATAQPQTQLQPQPQPQAQIQAPPQPAPIFNQPQTGQNQNRPPENSANQGYNIYAPGGNSANTAGNNTNIYR